MKLSHKRLTLIVMFDVWDITRTYRMYVRGLTLLEEHIKETCVKGQAIYNANCVGQI